LPFKRLEQRRPAFVLELVANEEHRLVVTAIDVLRGALVDAVPDRDAIARHAEIRKVAGSNECQTTR
jgi:hypothetical protein